MGKGRAKSAVEEREAFGLGREIWAIVVIAFGLFCMVSTLSYRQSDPSNPLLPGSNLCGVLGHSVGDFFAGTFGLACYPLFAFVVYWGLLIFLARPLPKPPLRVLGVFALVLVLAVFLAGNGTRGIMARTPHSFGGLLGQDLAPGLQANFGGFGAGLLLLVAGIVAFLVATDWPLHAIIADVRSTLDRGEERGKSSARAKADEAGVRVGTIVKSAFAKTGRAVLDLFGPATPPSVADEDEVAVATPKRKRRLVEEEPEEELEDDEEEEYEDEEYDDEYEDEEDEEDDEDEEYEDEEDEDEYEEEDEEEEEEETPRERRARLRRERAAAAAAASTKKPKAKSRRSRRSTDESEDEDHSEAEAAAAELVAESDEAAEAAEAESGKRGKAKRGKASDAEAEASAADDADDAEGADDAASEGDDDASVNGAEISAKRVPNERARAAAARTAREAAGESSDSGSRAVMPVHIVGIASTEARKRKETLGDYKYPGWELLEKTKDDQVADELVLREQALRIERRLRSHNVEAKVVSVSAGPAVTVFELELAEGTRVTTIPKFAPDLAAALKAWSVRIVAPIPGKHTVGVEVPNEHRSLVRLRELVELRDPGDLSKETVPLFLGRDVAGKPLITDLARMPHLLIAGATGSGKSVCINSILLSVLLTRSPDDCRLILIDPKMVELQNYSRVPHLLCPVVTSMKRAPSVLEWAVETMEQRYSVLSAAGVRNLKDYNALGEAKLQKRLGGKFDPERTPVKMPTIVMIIDEFADLMSVAANEVEVSIQRLAQKSRAVGIHVILATQRPSRDVITGLIKANLPTRIAFQVSSRVDSRVVLDHNGAEQLLGHGDMLYVPPGTSRLVRAQGTFVSDEEIHGVVEFLVERCGEQQFESALVQQPTGSGRKAKDKDALYDDAVRCILEEQRGSATLLQRKLSVGYTRASRLIELMAEDGIVGEFVGSKSREVLLTIEEWEEMQAAAGPSPSQGELFGEDAPADAGEPSPDDAAVMAAQAFLDSGEGTRALEEGLDAIAEGSDAAAEAAADAEGDAANAAEDRADASRNGGASAMAAATASSALAAMRAPIAERSDDAESGDADGGETVDAQAEAVVEAEALALEEGLGALEGDDADESDEDAEVEEDELAADEESDEADEDDEELEEEAEDEELDDEEADEDEEEDADSEEEEDEEVDEEEGDEEEEEVDEEEPDEEEWDEEEEVEEEYFEADEDEAEEDSDDEEEADDADAEEDGEDDSDDEDNDEDAEDENG